MRAQRINAEGLALIKRFESLRLEAYLCPGRIWTIGYGHTGPDIRMGRKITEAEADAYLRADVRAFERGVSELVTVPLTSNQFSALVSFAFNCGLEALRRSTLLKKLNAGEDPTPEFLRWNKVGGTVLLGLTRRRRAEVALYRMA